MYKPFNYHEILPTDCYIFPYNYDRRIWFFNEDVSSLLMTLSLVIDSFQDNIFEQQGETASESPLRFLQRVDHSISMFLMMEKAWNKILKIQHLLLLQCQSMTHSH